jgi:hypothetical protein
LPGFAPYQRITTGWWMSSLFFSNQTTFPETSYLFPPNRIS